MLNAFKMADEVLLQGVQGITDLITTPGLINTDFADVKMIMTNAGSALMGIGYASGDGRAVTAAALGDLEPAARGEHRGCPRHPAQHLRSVGPRPVRGERGGRDHQPRPRTPTPTSSSAPSSTTRSATRCASRSSPPASTASRASGAETPLGLLDEERALGGRGRRRRGRARRRRLRRPGVPALTVTFLRRPDVPMPPRTTRTRDSVSAPWSARRSLVSSRVTVRRSVGGADAWFTDRWGGVSEPPFHTIDLADHVGDDAGRGRWRTARASSARSRTRRSCGCSPTTSTAPPCSWRATTPSTAATPTAPPPIVPASPLVAIGADCAPIAIANDTACAAVHAGWRGAADGVVAAGVAAVRELGTGPVRAVVGPCVCVGHYEFGADALAELGRAPRCVRDGQNVGRRARVRPAAPRSSAASPRRAWTRSRCSTCARSSRRTTTRTVATASPVATASW